MARQIAFLLKPFLRAVIELIFYAPIWLTIGIYLLPSAQLPLWAALLVIVYCVPQFVFRSGKAIKNGYRILSVAILGILPVALLAALLPAQIDEWAWIACGLVGIAFVESSFRSLLHNWYNSFSTLIMLIMLFAAVGLQILKVITLAKLALFNSIFFALGIVACILFLYIHNERTVRDQQMIDNASTTIRRSVAMNRLYITIIALVVVGIALIRSVQEKLEQWLKQLYQWLLGWLSREPAAEQQPVEQPQQPQFDLGELEEASEPSRFWLVLEQILKWLAIAFIVVAVLVAIYYIVTKLIPLLLKLIHRMLNRRALLKQSGEGYTDEIEGIIPQKNKHKRKRVRGLARPSLKQWSKLSSREKVKALYVLALSFGLKQGEPIAASKTAQENLKLLMKDQPTTEIYNELLHSYNEIRYGNVEPDAQHVEGLRHKVEGQKN